MRKEVDAEDVSAAVDAVLLALGAACWIACGSTPNVPARLRPATSAALRSVVGMAVATTGRFVREAKEKGHRLEAGRAGPELSKELRALETACREMRDDYEGAVGAGERRGIPLDPTRLSLPEAGVTGRLDLSPFLSPPLRRAYREPSSLMRHPKEELPASFAGKYSPTWGLLLERLDESEILQLAPGPAVPRGPTGEDLRASVFAVRKDDDTDRSILNRQRRNAVEERVDGVTATFPHGSLVGEISLRPDEKLRVSADDLPDYCHTLAVTAERALTNAFGPILSVAEAQRHCGRAWARLSDEDREWAEATGRVATLWGAVPMGDGNAVSFSQEGHANVLSAGGCMRPEDLLVYQRPVPLGPVAEGLMVDDHLVLGRVPRDAKREDALAELAALESGDGEAANAAEGDVGVLARSLRAYDRAGLRPKAAKSVRFADDADFWGATVFGEVGVVRGKTSVLWRAFYVSLAVLRLKRTTVGLARALLGLWTHVMTFCRPGFALLSRCYEWLQEVGEPRTAAERRAIRRLPGRVQDELRLLLAFAPHFERDLRGGFSPVLACTDASSTLAATVSTTIGEAVQEALWVHRIQKRGYVRILEPEEAAWRCAVDEGDEHTAGVLERVFRFGEAGHLRKKGDAICPWAEDLVEGLDWDPGVVFRTKRTEHINVSEARAVGAQIDLEAADPRFHRTKGVFGIDSYVFAGAGSKGRSSSRMLNRPLRRSAPTLLLTRMQRGFVHLRSEFNPADDPTRRKPLRRARKPTPAWAAAARSRGTVALEEAYPELAGRRGAAPGVFRYQDDYAPEPEETDGEARLPGPEPRPAARPLAYGRAYSSDEAGDGPAGDVRERNRAGRAAVRARSAPEGIRVRPAAPATRRLRREGLALFEDYLSRRGIRWPVREPEEAGRLLAMFGDHWFRNGGTLGEFRAAIAAVSESRRAWRPWLTEAWDAATNWQLREPSEARVPLPEPGYRAGLAAALAWGWVGLAWYLALGWHAALRPGEALRLRRRDLTLPSDLLSARRVAFLRLPGTKTAGLSRWIASVQHARINDPEVVAWMEAELAELRPDERIVLLTRSQLAAEWRLLFGHLGFPVGRRQRGLVPSSLRAGGATERYVATESFDSVRTLLRHAVRSRATERYVQEAVAALAHARLPEDRRDLVYALGSVASTLVRARTREFQRH